MADSSNPISNDPSAPWARERTLQALAANSANSLAALKTIAKSVSTKEDYRELADALGEVVEAVDGLTEEERNRLAQAKAQTQATKDLRSALGYTAKSFEGFVRMDAGSVFGGLGNMAKSFQYQLGEGNRELGKFAGQAAIAAEVFQLIWTRGTEMANAVRDAYDSGIVFSGGISQLADEARGTGLDLATLGKLLTKHGQIVATLGIATTARLGRAFNVATRGGTELGMTLEQNQDTLLSYTEQLKYTGMLRGKSDEDLIQGAQEYGRELNLLSQATGKRREDINAEILQNQKKPNVNLLLSTLNDELRESAAKGLPALKVMAGHLGDDLENFIIAYRKSPALAIQQNRTLYNTLNAAHALGDITKLTNATLQNNTEGMKDSLDSIRGKLSAYGKQVGNQVGILGEQSELAQSYVLSLRERTDAEIKAREEYEALPESTKRLLAAQTEIQTAFNDLNNALSNLAANLLAPLAKPAVYLIKGLTGLATLVVDAASAFSYLLVPLRLFGDGIEYIANGIKYLLSYIPGFGEGGAGKGVTDAVIDTAAAGAMVIAVLKSGSLMKNLLTWVFNSSWAKNLFSAGGGIAKNLLGKLGMGGLGAGGTGGLGNLTGGIGSMGKMLGNALTGFGSVIKGAVTGVVETIASISGPLKTVISNLGAGLGSGIGNLLGGLIKGIGMGLAALGNPAVAPEIIIGAGVLAIALPLIGAGLAGATWIMSAALPKLAEGLQSFAGLDGENLEKVGLGVLALGAGLAALGVGEVVDGLGNLASSFLNLFSEDPISKLKRFGELGEPLGKAGDAMKVFADAYPKSIAAINNSVIDPQAAASFDKLKELFAGDGVFTSLSKWLFGNQDFVTQLVKLGESTDNIPVFASRITGFADAYTYLVDAFNQPLNAEALANLVGLTDLINRQAAASTPGIFGSLFGSSSAPEPAAVSAPTPGVQTAAARVAHTSPDQKHQQMMDLLGQINDNMAALLTVEDRQTRVLNDGFSRVSGVIH